METEIKAEDFARYFPKLYHVTFATNLDSIRQLGLLSATALAAHYGFTTEEREACLGRRRLCNQDLYGITLRDQNAASEARMKSSLVNVSIADWLALLNRKIFFFVEQRKALLFAETYSGYDNVLLATDTAKLLAVHGQGVTLCRINSGSFIYNARPRGVQSFIPLHEYLYKNKRDTPAELTVDVPVPDVMAISEVIATVKVV